MPPVQLKDIQAAIHKSAAGRQGQGSPEPAARPGGDLSAVNQDLAVMADQAAQFRTGQAAGNQAAQAELGQVTEGLQAERATADTARAEELEAQRREMQKIELERRANEEAAAQERAALQQRVALERAEAAERATQARMARAAQAAQDAERARKEAAGVEAEKEARRIDAVGRSVMRRYGENFQNTFGAVADAAANWGEALEAMDALERAGQIGTRPVSGRSIVSRSILEEELSRLYQVPKPRR